MALKKCKECGNQVSTKADKCPHCGAPVKSAVDTFNKLFIAFAGTIIVVVVFNLCQDLLSGESSSPSTESSNSTTTQNITEAIVFNELQLNMRSGPSTDYNVLKVLRAGTKLSVTDTTNGWYKVKGPGGFLIDGKTGWVSGSYTSDYSAYAEWKDKRDQKIESQRASQWKTENDWIAAYIMCEQWIEDRLRAPSTADFQSIWNGREQSVIRTLQRYKIESYVDSENGFGATIRTYFTCITTQTAEGEWTLNTLEFQE